MPARVQVSGISKLLAQLRDMAAKVSREWDVKVAVGYETNYAVNVHENMEAFHPNGQAKYLEQPARELDTNGTLATIVTKMITAGRTPAQAMVAAGLRLQRDSQKLVPVDTAALKNSAFTRLE